MILKASFHPIYLKNYHLVSYDCSTLVSGKSVGIETPSISSNLCSSLERTRIFDWNEREKNVTASYKAQKTASICNGGNLTKKKIILTAVIIKKLGVLEIGIQLYLII